MAAASAIDPRQAAGGLEAVLVVIWIEASFRVHAVHPPRSTLEFRPHLPHKPRVRAERDTQHNHLPVYSMESLEGRRNSIHLLVQRYRAPSVLPWLLLVLGSGDGVGAESSPERW